MDRELFRTWHHGGLNIVNTMLNMVNDITIGPYRIDRIVILGYIKRWAEKIPNTISRRDYGSSSRKHQPVLRDYWLTEFEIEDPKNADLWILVGLDIWPNTGMANDKHVSAPAFAIATNGEQFIQVNVPSIPKGFTEPHHPRTGDYQIPQKTKDAITDTINEHLATKEMK